MTGVEKFVSSQPQYSLLWRKPEREIIPLCRAHGISQIVFSPLAQGLLTDRYLKDIPADSRAAKSHGYLQEAEVTEARRRQIRALNEIAKGRGQSLAQLAITWVLRHPVVTSALIGASRVQQLDANLDALNAPPLAKDELDVIEGVLSPSPAT